MSSIGFILRIRSVLASFPRFVKDTTILDSIRVSAKDDQWFELRNGLRNQYLGKRRHLSIDAIMTGYDTRLYGVIILGI